MATEEQRQAYQEWQEKQKSHQSAVSNCWAACANKDLDELRDLFQSKQLHRKDAENVIGSTIEGNWLEGARFLLEQGVDCTKNYWVLEKCQSIEMFRLWGEFGLDFKIKGHQLLQYVLFYNCKAYLFSEVEKTWPGN
jgi:hypothetical protein